MVVEDSVEDHRLNFCSGRHARCGSLGLNELTDFCIVTVLFVGLVFIGVGLAFGMVGGFCFSDLLVELVFRCITRESRGRSQEVDVRRHICAFSVPGTAGTVFNEDGFDTRRRLSGFAVVARREGF